MNFGLDSFSLVQLRDFFWDSFIPTETEKHVYKKSREVHLQTDIFFIFHGPGHSPESFEFKQDRYKKANTGKSCEDSEPTEYDKPSG